MSNDMSLQETFERFDEGMKKAASRARELGHAQKNKNWFSVATQIEGLRAKALIMFKGPAISRKDALSILDVREKNLNING